MKDICFKAAFFDIDGTIIAGQTLTDETKTALNILKSSGCLLVISTGRNLYVVPDIVKKLKPDYYIVGNGTAIYDKNENLIKEYAITEDTYFTLIKEYGNHPTRGMSLRYLSGIVSVYNDQRFNTFFNHFGTGKHRSPVYIDPSVELPSNGVICTEEDLHSIRNKFPDLVFSSPLNTYYDFTPAGITKGTAIEYLCTLLDTDPSETISAGDGESDIDMFNITGYSIAMGNADDNVKKHADLITDSVENNGLAKAIYKICIGGQI